MDALPWRRVEKGFAAGKLDIFFIFKPRGIKTN